MPIARPQRGESDASGFGLVEIIVSMFMLALLAMAFLPVLIQGLKRTTDNSTLATATQIVSQELEQLRDSGSSCTAVKTFAAAAPAPLIHRQGTLQVNRSIDLPASDVCVAPYLRTVSVRLWVTDTVTGNVLADATTLVLLDAQ